MQHIPLILLLIYSLFTTSRDVIKAYKTKTAFIQKLLLFVMVVIISTVIIIYNF